MVNCCVVISFVHKNQLLLVTGFEVIGARGRIEVCNLSCSSLLLPVFIQFSQAVAEPDRFRMRQAHGVEFYLHAGGAALQIQGFIRIQGCFVGVHRVDTNRRSTRPALLLLRVDPDDSVT